MITKVGSLVEAVAFVREHHKEVVGLVAMPFDEEGAKIYASDENGKATGDVLVVVEKP